MNNPGAESIIRIQLDPNAATRRDYMLAIVYLSERLESVERQLADRTRAFTAPQPAEVEEYAKTISFKLDGRKFCDHYEARGWMIGKTKMKSWKAAVRTWKNYDTQPAGRTPDNMRTDHGL